MKITLEINEPEIMSHNLSDLLCWWQGFKTGLHVSGEDRYIVAEHGIEAARELNIDLRNAIRQNKQATEESPIPAPRKRGRPRKITTQK